MFVDVGEKMEASNDLDSVIQLGDYSINYGQLSGMNFVMAVLLLVFSRA